MRFKKLIQISLSAGLVVPVLSMVWGTSPSKFSGYSDLSGTRTIPIPVPLPLDTPSGDSLKFPFHDRYSDPYSSQYNNSPLYLNDPENIKTTIEYNPDDKQYDINERMGDLFYRDPSYMTFEEFKEAQFKNSTRKYWQQRSSENDILQRKGFNPKLYVGGDVFDRIFGGNTIDIRPQGSAELTFGLNIQHTENPSIPVKQRTNTSFDFKEKIQMNVIGNIGEKMKLGVNYNTEAGFDFENKMKLEYTGKEDEIIQKIEAGNITLPLTGSLIQGSQTLFGIKTALKFGRMNVTTVFSQQKGQRSTINVPPGGGQITNYEILADQYEANKHFFLAQYFKDNYDNSLKNLPVINSPINITKIEVWKTNRTAVTEGNRDIVSFMDLGEYNYFAHNLISQGASVYPSDSLSNNLYKLMTTTYSGIRSGDNAAAILSGLGVPPTNFLAQQDYVIIRNAKMLNSSEYTFNARLGYISLNSALNPDEAIAVAFEYTIGNTVYRVGELSTSGVQPPNTLILKLLRSKTQSPDLPTWGLMMKNIYSLNGYQIQKDNFKLDIYYADDADGGKKKRYISAGATESFINGNPLIKVFGLDTLNSNGDAGGDGVFDFVEGITINTQNGRIIFPEREPFGSYLKSKFNDQSQNGLASKYIYQELYDSTLTVAQQFAIKNKFSIAGSYQSASGAEISLNAINIPQGSVTVTAGGRPLVENTDFTVDYNLGRVKIINAGILASNTPIQVSVESQSLFSIQSKTLIGARFDYAISKDFTIGGTYLHLNERPITQKVNIGDEPISNTIWGVDGTYRTDSRFITKWIDKLPFYATKEKSSVTVSGEFAQLIPGHSSAIGSAGNAYIDDFEGSQSTIDIRNPSTWFLASTPMGNLKFPETQGIFADSLAYGYNRAQFAWYTIDPSVFYRDNASLLPSDLQGAAGKDSLSNNNVRAVLETEIFPNHQNPNNVQTELSVLNLGYYPEERGPYNFDVEGIPGVSSGLDSTNGQLKKPETRWGGIMRRIETNDFEASNVQFIQFWLMDPFNSESLNNDPDPTKVGGQLYFDLGNISEDIMRDGAQFFENGLPASTNNYTVDSTRWGLHPKTEYLISAFDLNDVSRTKQDVGLDGLSSSDEVSFFGHSYIDRLTAAGVNATVVDTIKHDPCNDDFFNFRSSFYDNEHLGILDRYKKFNGTEGNSNTATPDGYSISATTVPDNEDINKDFQTDQDESYNEYKVDFKQSSNQWDHVVDSTTATAQTPDGKGRTVKWYQFKIPVNEGFETINQGANLKSVNFIRMYMKGWSKPVIMRFGKLELLRGEWRKYQYNVDDQGENLGKDPLLDLFDISVVNLEENGKRSPIPYVIPPGIEREIAVGTTNNQQLNEQSLALKVCGLPDGDAKAAYKSTQFDVRNYKKIKMFIHAEEMDSCSTTCTPLKDNDVVAFARFGTDFSANYYEYNIPLKITTGATSDPALIWPTSNELDIDIQTLVDAKLKRDREGIPYATPDTIYEPDGRLIRIVGNPSLSNVKSIMIGIKNPHAPDAGHINPYNNEDDGQPKCVEIWVNELRMTDFNEKGGWAATARVQAKLADLGMVTVSGAKSTYGFGALESKMSERQQDNREQYDISSSLELGKFFPQKIGLSIPFYIGYSKAIANPYYNPLDPDVKFGDALNNLPDDAQRNELKKITQDYTRRNSYNFTNVKKNKVGSASKSHVYDIENFNLTYGYSEIYRRNVNTEYDLQKDYLAAIGYNYFSTAKGISPFAKAKGMKSKYLRPIKDFNVNFIPSNFSFRTDVNRHYGELKLRNINDDQYAPPPTYDKRFLMTRQYALTWDLTKSLKFDFDANNISKIDEPAGRLDTPDKRSVMWSNFWSGGRNTDYHHSGTLSYNVPLNKFPITDWISVNARYGFDFHWMASSLVYDPAQSYAPRINPVLGNTIQNSNTKQINNTLTFSTLYNKIPLFKKLLSPPKPKQKAPPKAKVDPKAPKDSAAVKKPPVPVPKEKEYGPVVRGIAKLFLSLKTFSLNYTESKGTLLPGYTRTSQILGQDFNNGGQSPGYGFAFGEQDPLFKYRMAENKWITQDTSMNNQFTNTVTRNLTLRSTIEPTTGLRIELNATRSRAQNHSEYFRYSNADQNFQTFSALDAGNFSISWLTINTAFTKDNKDYTSDVFNKFNTNRQIISKRLALQNPNSTGIVDSGYVDGYGATSQEVLTFAFLSAYSGRDANTIKLNPFPSTPLPNWRITYDGLSKLAFAKKLFQSVSLTHGYRSSYSINSYSSSLLYKQDGSARNQVYNFISRYEFGQISITEEFSPLLGIDVGWKINKNTLSTRIEFKRDRNLSLDFAGVQLTEVKGSEIVLGAGYRFKPKFKLKLLGKQQSLANDLNVTADISFRKNSTILRKLQEQIDQPTAGLNSYGFDFAADYNVSERFNVKAFFKRDGSTPLISTSFPISTTAFGITLRFTLAQ